MSHACACAQPAASRRLQHAWQFKHQVAVVNCTHFPCVAGSSSCGRDSLVFCFPPGNSWPAPTSNCCYNPWPKWSIAPSVTMNPKAECGRAILCSRNEHKAFAECAGKLASCTDQSLTSTLDAMQPCLSCCVPLCDLLTLYFIYLRPGV